MMKAPQDHAVPLAASHTYHSFARSKQRGITDADISLVLEYGMATHKQGLCFFMLGKNHLPSQYHHKRLMGLVVITNACASQIITCYRVNRFSALKKKSSHLFIASPEEAPSEK